MPHVDSAILDALDLDPTAVSIRAHGGSGFSSTFRLTGRCRGDGAAPTMQSFFVKTGNGPDAAVMFTGEHASLNAIADAVPGFCPRAHAHGALRDHPGGHFLATGFLDLQRSAAGSRRGSSSGPSFAERLAALHTTEMPPARSGAPVDRPFGFPVPTCCGATEQDNTWTASWADFFADRRLRHILRIGQRAHGSDRALADAVERTATTVVPRLLRDGHLQRAAARGGGGIVPVVVHGDLWSGNYGFGVLEGGGQRQTKHTPLSSSSSSSSSSPSYVVYDPACVYGHSEYELGIMRMFGGFDGSFWREYTALVPKDEPVAEWEDRLELYELYHHLNHYALFGSSYRSGAMSIMQKLLSKYG